MLYRFLGSQQQTEDVQVELLVKMLFGDFFERRRLVNAGVVHQDVEPAERLLRFGEQSLDLGLLGHIRLHRDGLPALLVISATTRSAPSLLEL